MVVKIITDMDHHIDRVGLELRQKLYNLKKISNDNTTCHMILLLDFSGSMSNELAYIKKSISQFYKFRAGLNLKISLILYSDIGNFNYIQVHLNISYDEIIDILDKTTAYGGGRPNEECSYLAIKLAHEFHRKMYKDEVYLYIVNITDENFRSNLSKKIIYTIPNYQAYMERAICEYLRLPLTPVNEFNFTNTFILTIGIRNELNFKDFNNQNFKFCLANTEDIMYIMLDALYFVFIRPPLTIDENLLLIEYNCGKIPKTEDIKDIYKKINMPAKYNIPQPIAYINQDFDYRENIYRVLSHKNDKNVTNFIENILELLKKSTSDYINYAFLSIFFQAFKRHELTSQRINLLLEDNTTVARMLFNNLYTLKCTNTLYCIDCKRNTTTYNNATYIYLKNSWTFKSFDLKLSTYEDILALLEFIDHLVFTKIRPNLPIQKYRTITDNSKILSIMSLYKHYILQEGSRQAELFRFFLNQRHNLELTVNYTAIFIINDALTSYVFDHSYSIFNNYMDALPYGFKCVFEFIANASNLKLFDTLNTNITVNETPNFYKFNKLVASKSTDFCTLCLTYHPKSFFYNLKHLPTSSQHKTNAVTNIVDNIITDSVFETTNLVCMNQLYNRPPAELFNNPHMFKCVKCSILYFVNSRTKVLKTNKLKPVCPSCNNNLPSVHINCQEHGKIWNGFTTYYSESTCLLCDNGYVKWPIKNVVIKKEPLINFITVDMLSTIIQSTYCAPLSGIIVTNELLELLKCGPISNMKLFKHIGLLDIFNRWILNDAFATRLPSKLSKVNINMQIINKLKLDHALPYIHQEILDINENCAICDESYNLIRGVQLCPCNTFIMCHQCYWSYVKVKFESLTDAAENYSVNEWLTLKCLKCTNPLSNWHLKLKNLQKNDTITKRRINSYISYYNEIANNKSNNTSPKLCVTCDTITYAMKRNDNCCTDITPPKITFNCCTLNMPNEQSKELYTIMNDIKKWKINIDWSPVFINSATVPIKDSITNVICKYTQDECIALYESTKNTLEFKLKIKSMQQCPTCNTFISKLGNCAHVICSICECNICWLCSFGFNVPKCKPENHSEYGSLLRCLYIIDDTLMTTNIYDYDDVYGSSDV